MFISNNEYLSTRFRVAVGIYRLQQVSNAHLIDFWNTSYWTWFMIIVLVFCSRIHFWVSGTEGFGTALHYQGLWTVNWFLNTGSILIWNIIARHLHCIQLAKLRNWSSNLFLYLHYLEIKIVRKMQKWYDLKTWFFKRKTNCTARHVTIYDGNSWSWSNSGLIV